MSSGSQNEFGWTQADFSAPPPPQPVGDALARPLPQAQAQVSGQGYVQQVMPVVVAKNGAVGVLLSLFIPGLGSMVSGSVGRGILILAVYLVGWLLTIVLIGIPIVFGAWVWGMIDGYLSAQRWNRAHGILS